MINGCLEKGAKVSESALLQDKITDEPREVDILIETHTPGYPVTIAIEVIDHNRRAGTPWVEQMHKKHEALDTHMLVLVSRNGFTKPVRVKAKFYNIEAITFDDAMTTDWDLVARMTESGFFEITSFHYDCKLVYELLIQYLRQNARTCKGFCRRVVVELSSTTATTLNPRRSPR